MRAHWLGLDVGSGSVRALLIDEEGRLRPGARRALAARRPSPTRVEYDPEVVLRAASGCLRDTLRRLPRGSVRAVGLAAQRSTFLLWRRGDGRPLTPALGWQSRDAGPPPSPSASRRLSRLSGLRWSPHYSGPRAASLLRREPRLRRLLESGRACLGTLDSFLLYRWSGGAMFRTDPTHAQRTLLYSPARGGWDARLLRYFGVPAEALAEVAPCAGIDLPLPGLHASLAASCGDQQAALHAVQAHAPRACLVNYGTGAFVLVPRTSGARRPPGFLLAEAVGGAGERALALEAPIPTAAAAFELLGADAWAVASRGPRDAGVAPGGSAAAMASPPVLVAAMDGLGAPFWLEDVPSLLLFFGRRLSPADLAAAAEASIAASVQAALERVRPAPARLVTSGGLSARDGLLQRQADLAGRRVERLLPLEWTAIGAALLAAGAQRPSRLRLRVDSFAPDPRRRPDALRDYRVWRKAVSFLGSLGSPGPA